MWKEGLLAKGFKRRKDNYGKAKLIEDYIKENILKREFHQEIINKIRVTDITYITRKDGRLYLATYYRLNSKNYKILFNRRENEKRADFISLDKLQREFSKDYT